MKLKYVVVAILFSLFMIGSVDAASANISVTANKSQVVVGETVTVTVRISSNDNLGSWQFDVVPSSNLSLSNSSFDGGLYIKDVVESKTQKSKSYTFTFKAVASGTASVAVKNSLVYGYDENTMSTSNGSVNLTLRTRAEIEASYSKNNNLASLTVEGFELSPKFDKNTTTYNLELENGTESIKVNATKEDNTARINGTGEIALSEGANEIKIIVTAQNGSTKTYTINATVKDLDPIEVTVDGNKYTVVRKKEFLPNASIYYQDTTITIGEETVPAYSSETTKLTLVGLKSENGSIDLYIYDNGKYTKYSELGFGSMALIPEKPTTIPEGYNTTTIFVGEKTVEAYKSEKYEFPLLYGMNVATGKVDFYKYDKQDNTLQRYEMVTLDKTNESLYFYVIVGLFGFTVISYIVFIALLCKKNKKQSDILEKTMKIAKITDEDIEKHTNKKASKNNNIEKESVKTKKKKTKKNNDDDDMAVL